VAAGWSWERIGKTSDFLRKDEKKKVQNKLEKEKSADMETTHKDGQ
jgi:hypothetical protein